MNKFKEGAILVLKWLILGLILGVVSGVIGTLFHASIDLSNLLRKDYWWSVYLIPVGALLITFLYKESKLTVTADSVLLASHTDGKLPFKTIPLIFVSTCITQFVGGSAGKEGAAIQIGGTLGYQLGKVLKLDEKTRSTAVMAGLAAVFASVFGTPITAAFFAIEITSVGSMYYFALIPCVTAVVTAYMVSKALGVAPLVFSITFPSLGVKEILLTILLGVITAIVSIGFCEAVHGGSKLASKYIGNVYIKALVVSVILMLLFIPSFTLEYQGAGLNLISSAINGEAKVYDFILKILFTTITIAAGFKGGEIVPTMAVGATLGCAFALVLGLDPSFYAALGLIGLFCGNVNCPVASTLLGIELFGAEGTIYYVIMCTIAFALSGKFGLYESQKQLESKVKANF